MSPRMNKKICGKAFSSQSWAAYRKDLRNRIVVSHGDFWGGYYQCKTDQYCAIQLYPSNLENYLLERFRVSQSWKFFNLKTGYGSILSNSMIKSKKVLIRMIYLGKKSRLWWNISEKKYLIRNYPEERNKESCLACHSKMFICLSSSK